MNKHIVLVKNWLNDPSSVTKEELRANTEDAYAYSYAAAADFSAAYAAFAAYGAESYDFSSAAYWVKRYEELIK